MHCPLCLLMEDTALVRRCIALFHFPFAMVLAMGFGQKFPRPGWAPDFHEALPSWVLAPAVPREQGQYPALSWFAIKLSKVLKSGLWVHLTGNQGMQQVSIENLTFWTCFCFQGSERQISYWLWLEYEQALKQRNQFSLCAIIPFVADKHWWI